MKFSLFMGFLTLAFGISTYVTDYDYVRRTDAGAATISVFLMVIGSALLAWGFRK